MVAYNKDDGLSFGKPLHAIDVGDTFTMTERFRERDILLYMGVTNDINPRYLKTEEAHQVVDLETVIPPIALMGAITRTVSMHFPGPGSMLVEMNFTINKAIRHDSTITYHFEVIRIEEWRGYVTIHVIGNNETTGEDRVLDAMLMVLPPEEALTDQPKIIDSSELKRVDGGDVNSD